MPASSLPPRSTTYASARIALIRYATTGRFAPLAHSGEPTTAAIHLHSLQEHIGAEKPSRRVKPLTRGGCVLRQLLLSSWATGPPRGVTTRQQHVARRTERRQASILSVHTGSWPARPTRRGGERLSRRARRNWRFGGGLCEDAGQGPSDAILGTHSDVTPPNETICSGALAATVPFGYLFNCQKVYTHTS